MSERPTLRPMTADDYEPGDPQPMADMPHPTRDLIIGAVVGAAALWAVPKVLDYAASLAGFGGQDEGVDEFDLEPYE